MSDVKICLTAIFKDDSEYELAKRMLDSFMPHVDGLAVVITGLNGKHKKLRQLIEENKGHCLVVSKDNNPDLYSNDGQGDFFSHFANARNISFGLADSIGEFDYYTWADVDDMLLGGEEFRKTAQNAKDKKIDQVFFSYWYSVKVDKDNTFNEKNVQVFHLRERLVRPKMFKWISRLHEVEVPIDNSYRPTTATWDYNEKEGRGVAWAHLTTRERSEKALNRNLRILLEQEKEENSKDPRTLKYIGKVYSEFNTEEADEKALSYFEKYIPLSGWAEEVADAWTDIAMIYSRKGSHKAAIDALFEAAKLFGDRPIQYLRIAQEYENLKLYKEADFWLDTALKMKPPKADITIGNPLELKVLAVSLQLNRALRSNNLEDAIFWAKSFFNMAGGKKEDAELVSTLEEAKALNDAAHNVLAYAQWLKSIGQEEKVGHLLESLPPSLGKEPFAAYMANEIKPPKKWGDKSIVYFASFGAQHFEEWSGKSLGTGIGGSETAVIELSKQWVKDGYEVTVFGDPGDETDKIEGVDYRPWYELNWKDEFNTLILWRSPHLLDREIKAKNLYMDLHDVASQLDWPDHRMNRIDKVFFKSEYHKKMLPKLPEDKKVVISNGIEL